MFKDVILEIRALVEGGGSRRVKDFRQTLHAKRAGADSVPHMRMQTPKDYVGSRQPGTAMSRARTYGGLTVGSDIKTGLAKGKKYAQFHSAPKLPK